MPHRVYYLSELTNEGKKQLKKMGKTRKGFKNEIRAPEKTPLDEQITSGKVVRSKNKLKIRLRAEEEDVSAHAITKVLNVSSHTLFIQFHP